MVMNMGIRQANFHRNTIKATIEVMEACGFASLQDIKPDKIFRRVEQGKNLSFEQNYFNQAGNSFTIGHNLIPN